MIKNYTSEVPASRSVLRIEEQLMKHGAKNIMKIIEQQKLIGIAFIIPIGGTDTPFRLPARIDRVELQLKKLIKRPRKGTLSKVSEQAARTAWKILADWVDIQMALVELDQAEFGEVFLPYMYDYQKEETFFDKMKASGYKMLENKTR